MVDINRYQCATLIPLSAPNAWSKLGILNTTRLPSVIAASFLTNVDLSAGGSFHTYVPVCWVNVGTLSNKRDEPATQRATLVLSPQLRRPRWPLWQTGLQTALLRLRNLFPCHSMAYREGLKCIHEESVASADMTWSNFGEAREASLVHIHGPWLTGPWIPLMPSAIPCSSQQARASCTLPWHWSCGNAGGHKKELDGW